MTRDKKLKILLISFVFSLPFWWGMNILAGNLEDFLFWQEMAKSPEVFTAQVKIPEKEIKTPKITKILANDLKIGAKAAISVEIDNKGNEKVLFEKESQRPLPIASLTKLMTALVVFDLDESYNLSQLISITKEAVEQEEKYGELKEGEELSVENLLYIMLIESSNDAAYAITEPVSQEGFVQLMNFYAEDLGLENTKFINSTGLEPDDSQEPSPHLRQGEAGKNFSSAQDLVKLSKYIFKKYPQIFEITTNNSYEVLSPDGSLHHFIPENTNELLTEFPNIIGGKTGWSPLAGGCLLLVLENPEKKSYVINVILGAGDRFEEMRKLIKLTGQK